MADGVLVWSAKGRQIFTQLKLNQLAGGLFV
jgi:hypothetical protein